MDVLVTIKTFLPSFPGTGGPGSSLPECREMPGATTDSQELTCYSKSVPHSGSPWEALAEPVTGTVPAGVSVNSAPCV